MITYKSSVMENQRKKVSVSVYFNHNALKDGDGKQLLASYIFDENMYLLNLRGMGYFKSDVDSIFEIYVDGIKYVNKFHLDMLSKK